MLQQIFWKTVTGKTTHWKHLIENCDRKTTLWRIFWQNVRETMQWKICCKTVTKKLCLGKIFRKPWEKNLLWKCSGILWRKNKALKKYSGKLQRRRKQIREILIENIARGTTDPGYRLRISIYLYSLFSFLTLEIPQDTKSMPWVRCASSNVFKVQHPNLFERSRQVASLALVPILPTRWRYMNWLLTWPPDGTTCIVVDLASSWHFLN